MSVPHRIRTIYAKELIDILRDHRTLIAMIVVPIVLYPLLMLGSLQAVSYQVETIKTEALTVGVLGEAQGRILNILIEQHEDDVRARRDQEDVAREAEDAPQALLAPIKCVPYDSKEALMQAVVDRRIHVAVVIERGRIDYRFRRHNPITIFSDKTDIRSAHGMHRIKELFELTGKRKSKQFLRRHGLPELVISPFTVIVSDLSSSPSVLGQILPLILILMTITGAIYPAIDLTAGERERGTLESLMVCPVPVFDLVMGKFLVVATVAIMGATLNLASASATVYFGGFDKVISSYDEGLSFATMGLILLCLIPFAVLMSAVMIAVCSYARTFKEAQNYAVPVIFAVLVPGGLAAMPGTMLSGVMLVMPVGNMVLLTRELLIGVPVPLWQFAAVLGSTSLYAVAAVAVAASVFGRESVVFSDAGSLTTLFRRSLLKPLPRSTVAMSLLFVAVLFPTWFFIQTSLSMNAEGDLDVRGLLVGSARLMPLLFVCGPIAVMLYWKVDLVESLSLRVPSARYFAAAVLIGLAAWVPAYELNVLQQRLWGSPGLAIRNAELLAEAVSPMNLGLVLVLIAVTPAICEELLFRGFLLNGVGAGARKWLAILVSAGIFGVFHFLLDKFLVTASLGVVLGLLCWQSRSILPGIIAHCLHNTIGACTIVWPELQTHLGLPSVSNELERWPHIQTLQLVIGLGVFAIGVWIAVRSSPARSVGPVTATPAAANAPSQVI